MIDKTLHIGLFLVGTILLFSSCKKESTYEEYRPQGDQPNLPAENYDYSSENAPQHFIDDPVLQLFGTFEGNNGITDDGATLGRVLFYDKALSSDQTISCGSCHIQELAFTDDAQFSEGVDGFTGRNSMPIFNMRLNRRFFWDHRANSVSQQVLVPIQNEVEMDMTLEALIERLKTISYYSDLFEDAFGDIEITEERISSALSQFVRSITSYRSKYDAGFENDFADYTQDELTGKELFLSGDFRCNHCHRTVNFGGVDIFNNGLDLVYTDEGQAAVTGDNEDIGKFKVSSLRNVELTAPYMHDGRFQTLDEVFDFYSSDIQAHFNLDDRLTSDNQTGGVPVVLNITEEQKMQMIAFLNTLTDNQMITDPKFSNPFE